MIGHGGEAETSLLMAIAPQAVRPDYMKPPDPRPNGFPRAMQIQRAWYQDEYNPGGNTDDPRSANKKKGEKLLDAAVKEIIAALANFIKYKPVQAHQ